MIQYTTTLHYTELHYPELHYPTLNYITLHYSTVHYNTRKSHNITLDYIMLRHVTLHDITLHYTALIISTSIRLSERINRFCHCFCSQECAGKRFAFSASVVHVCAQFVFCPNSAFGQVLLESPNRIGAPNFPLTRLFQTQWSSTQIETWQQRSERINVLNLPRLSWP